MNCISIIYDKRLGGFSSTSKPWTIPGAEASEGEEGVEPERATSTYLNDREGGLKLIEDACKLKVNM
jgi:hypothetical protein